MSWRESTVSLYRSAGVSRVLRVVVATEYREKGGRRTWCSVASSTERASSCTARPSCRSASRRIDCATGKGEQLSENDEGENVD